MYGLGFKGQARVIIPTVTSCYECSLDMLNKPTVFPICTIANTPRLPEHCIEWASVLEWPKVHGGELVQFKPVGNTQTQLQRRNLTQTTQIISDGFINRQRLVRLSSRSKV